MTLLPVPAVIVSAPRLPFKAGDQITGSSIANELVGGKGGDTLIGLGGADSLLGKGGSDDLDADDGVADTKIACAGGSSDSADVDVLDPAPTNCETVL